ncbi:MAG TPA: hypothetical protein VFD70_11095 [Anaerolineae bacterium]|nr:hypothetical protein [Anaerolineae bacterium]
MLNLNRARKFAIDLHRKQIEWRGEAFGWQAEYNPSRAAPPLDSKMTFTPADLVIGESGIWFFSMMWEHGDDEPPIEFLDDRNIVGTLAGNAAS